MNKRLLTAIAALALCTGSLGVGADTMSSKGYSLEDYHLGSAQDLVDLCTLEESHPDYAIAKSFCYGFFEGAIHYHDTIKEMPGYVEIVCDPEGTTRTAAVIEFTRYLQSNPQYGSEMPLDAVFRALSARWPCSTD